MSRVGGVILLNERGHSREIGCSGQGSWGNHGPGGSKRSEVLANPDRGSNPLSAVSDYRSKGVGFYTAGEVSLDKHFAFATSFG